MTSRELVASLPKVMPIPLFPSSGMTASLPKVMLHFLNHISRFRDALFTKNNLPDNFHCPDRLFAAHYIIERKQCTKRTDTLFPHFLSYLLISLHPAMS